MAEEKNTPQNNEPVKNDPPALTPIEERALEQGWVPKDQWEGDPEEWRPAKEFIDRGELFKRIEDQSRTIKQMKHTFDQFSKHHEKALAAEYKRALEDLKAKKKAALVDGDPDAVIEIDEEIAEVREAQKNASVPTVPQVPQADPTQNVIFQNWVSKNRWYNANPAMRAFADRVGNDLGARGGISPSDLLSAVEREVKAQFPEKFNNPNRDKPGAVEGATNKSTKSTEKFELSDDERRAMRRFVQTIPGYTEEKYIAELKKIKGV